MIATYQSDEPFYVWKYTDEITKLLHGEKVILNANIETAPEYVKYDNAAKLKNILFNFHFAN